ncbi:DUF2264 domain-containing protein [Allostreptomyces psammosilenae]|uniref:DUF2264 domain-containing protein n=1 Tax=Allostreptomyces psammosilenae TaxID=1892865 RepID=A0A852ZVG4_9ACTN|nr:DUF2264 domain-containing protein [Allostreptomyces psammosilenae]NYI04774.1 hypothetical protein [Allostreptomyces psammosilenae]
MTTTPTGDDPTLSPFTGWTRAHWEQTADRMLTAVRPHASPRGALIDLPGPPSGSGRWSDGLEGYARTFLLAAFRIAGSGGQAPGSLIERYADGLDAGTDPASPERWPRLDELAQARVEAASVALALHETRPHLWDRLPERVRARVVDWFTPMLGARMPNCNWVWFQAVVGAFLRSVDAPWRPADIDRTIDLTEQWYAGDGWYSDGDEIPGDHRNFDHYSGWAMHFYPLWYCRISGPKHTAPELAERYRARLRRYLADAQHLVSPSGPPLFQGRSLTYRFAALAPFWAGALFDATPLTPGATRRLASGMLRHFLDAGSLDERDLLTLGWYGEHTPIRQNYSGPASPYWASKGFAGLLLPADHPVWTAPEEALPSERRDVELAISAPGWTVSTTAADGIVRIANHGTDHAAGDMLTTDNPLYARWAYSSHTGPDPDAPTDGDIAAAHVTLVDAEDRAAHRGPLRRVALDGRVGVSRHRAHWRATDGTPGPVPHGPSPWVTTASVLHGPQEVRLARVDPDAGGPLPPLRLRISGHAIADATPPTAATDERGAVAVHRPDGLTATATVLLGPLSTALARTTGRSAHGRHSAIPYTETAGPVEAGQLYAVLLGLHGAGGTPPEGEVRVAVEEDATGARVRVSWPDGAEDELRLDPPRDPALG